MSEVKCLIVSIQSRESIKIVCVIAGNTGIGMRRLISDYKTSVLTSRQHKNESK
jgi:hypothetical protein